VHDLREPVEGKLRRHAHRNFGLSRLDLRWHIQGRPICQMNQCQEGNNENLEDKVLAESWRLLRRIESRYRRCNFALFLAIQRGALALTALAEC